jgi:hypothetical protein
LENKQRNKKKQRNSTFRCGCAKAANIFEAMFRVQVHVAVAILHGKRDPRSELFPCCCLSDNTLQT